MDLTEGIINDILEELLKPRYFRNFDQNTLRVIMDMFKEYVPPTEYFPTVKEVTDFKNEYWEEKIMKTEMLDGNVFSYLKPEGMISLRLSHPDHALSFDRVPRRNPSGDKTTQSSGDKFSDFSFRKLGNFFVGDMVKLSRVDYISVPGENQRIPCQMYLLITAFYITGTSYMAEGFMLFHSSMRQMRDRVTTDSFIIVKDKLESFKLADLKLEQTLRSQNVQPIFCPSVYDEQNQVLVRMTDLQVTSINTLLEVSLQTGCVQVVTNLHIDDASQVNSKVWKSASVFDVQLAGAGAGIKGNEFNNMILGLTDTATISLKRLFDGICADFVRLGSTGFECFDMFTKQIEKVKVPVAAVLSDLPAKAEISPFTGWQADVFCPKDMYSTRTKTGLDIPRDLATVRTQIRAIKLAATQAAKKRLGVQFGLDINNLDTVLDTLNNFDVTQDMPGDILHHFTLGWGKKSLVFLKNDILSKESLDQICQIFDQIAWKEYTSRTNSNALRKIGSQIGRNIRNILQVVWYGLWVMLGFDPDRYRGELEVFLRVFFYIGKLNYMFYNKHEVTWSAGVMTQLDDALTTVVAIFRRDMEVLVAGPETHDLEHHLQTDIIRHGSPAGFDCQAGESKMKVQKFKNNYSNKQAPGKDVAMKYLRTEIVRHIVSGGALSADGMSKASRNVLDNALKYTSVRGLLGIVTGDKKEGQASLLDYESVNGRRKQKFQNPKIDHILIGVPDVKMRTCNRILTSNGPVYRGGGLYTNDENGLQLGLLIDVYKSRTGTYAIIENLQDSSHQNSDNFLQEAGIKVWRRSNQYRMISNLLLLKSVPLLHACKFEVPPVSKCEFVTGMTAVREERQLIQQRKTTYKCIGKAGNFFLASAACLSLPPGIGLGCI